MSGETTQRPEAARGIAVPIAVVERETGIAKETLRVWERRYGYPRPARDARGERQYGRDDLDTLRLLRRLLDLGHRPGTVVGRPVGELQALLQPVAEGALETAEAGGVGDWIAMLRLHEARALRVALHRALAREGLQAFVIDTLAPLNQTVGAAWAAGTIGVAEEHQYTEAVETLLRQAIAAQGFGQGRGEVVLATLAGEEHGLGLLMVEALLVSEGVRCRSVGRSIPASELVRAAGGRGVAAVAVSFSAARTPRHVATQLGELRAALDPQVALWAGGAGVGRRPRSIDGVRHFHDLTTLLEEARALHPAS